MKKIFFMLLVGGLLTGAGCETMVAPTSVSSTSQTSSTTVNVNNEGRYVDYSYIEKSLKNNKQIKEINLSRSFAMPSTDIKPGQLQKYFQLGTGTFVGYFAVFQTKSSNTGFDLPEGRAGILFAKNDDKQWQVLFDIKNKTPRDRNNPFYFWNEGSKLYLLVSDDNGAGSGEGTAKILSSVNGGKNWNIDRCFYFVPDHFFDKQRSLGLNFFPWFRKNLRTSFDKGGIVGFGEEYTFNPTKADFEIEQFSKESAQKETVVNDDCKNIILP